MTGCLTCGGFGNRHDPIAHDVEPGDWFHCPYCQAMCSPAEWACFRCGNGFDEEEES